MKPAHIRLHIDELVLEGFEPGDRDRIAAAVEDELGRLLTEGVTEGGLPGPSRDVVDGGQFSVPSAARPEAVGEQVARTLYGVLKQSRS